MRTAADNVLWMCVTPDEYELPIAIADTCSELAKILSVSESAIRSAESKYRTGTYRYSAKYKIVRVILD